MTASAQRPVMTKKIRKKKPRNKPILEPEVTDSLQNSSLIRALGSPDRDTREKGLALLTKWLETHEHVSEYDMLRLWKGLYFCFWHSDLISIQTALAERLSQLIVDLSPRVALAYYQGFVQTMKREWAGIDQHRINKYLVLVRKVYAASLRRLERSKWDPDVVEQYCSLLQDNVLLMPTANELGAGFAYFVCDIAVEEIVKAGEAAGPGKKQPKGETVVALLQPFVEGLVATKNKILLRRLHTGVFSEVAQNVEKQIKPFDSVDGTKLAEDLFARGSNHETRALNRKYIYQVSSELEMAGKQAEATRPKVTRKPDDVDATPAKAKKTAKDKKNATKDQKETPAKTNGADTTLEKKPMKSKKRAGPFGSPLDVAVAEEEETPVTTSTKKKKKKTKRTSLDGETDAGDGPPARNGPAAKRAATSVRATQAAKEDTPEVPPRRKSVRINLKKNLIRTIGEQPYPENVRTPPTSKPRGSALKRMETKLKKSARRSLSMK